MDLDKQEAIHQTVIAGYKAAPAITGAVYYGYTLNEWVAIVTILYVALQIGLLLPTYLKLLKNFLSKLKK